MKFGKIRQDFFEITKDIWCINLCVFSSAVVMH